MSEQIQETTMIVNPELYISNQLPEVNHMIANKTYYPIILPFPPVIKPKDLIINKKSPQDYPNGKQIRAPNAFIIYRKAFVKAARDQGYILPMTAISSLASASWDQESTIVKDEYKKIAKDAHKLIKEMFPKKSNQRKRKEKWNIVSFQDKSDKDNKNNSIVTNLSNIPENSSSEIISAPELTGIITSSSSPNLSECDSNISEKSFVLQQPANDNVENIDEGQVSNNYLIDELNTNIPNSFQEYLNSSFHLPEDNQSENNFLLTNWLNQSIEELELPDVIDNLKNNSQSSLEVTLSEVMGIINSENFNFNFEL